MKKIIPLLVLSVGLVATGLFLLSKKSFSFELSSPSAKKQLTIATYGSGSSVKILFVGDMMFDRYIRQVREKRGSDFIFAGVKKVLSENDLVVGNLEGPITDNPSISVESTMGDKNNYVFTFDSQTSADLWKNNIRLVNIGNNHILNFGADGLAKTKEYLKSGGIDFFGDPAGEKRFSIWQHGGVKIAFVGYNQFENDAASKTLNDINAAKQASADRIILYTHWGKEFTAQPEDDIRTLAHGFIDAGVDLIIGSHPHVIQSKEEYKGKTIYYSLGNFIFDQYFSPQTQKGLAVQVEINPENKKIVLNELPITMKNSGQTLQK